MSGRDNLIPLQDRPPEERRKIAAAGGRASSRMQAGRKLLRESLADKLGEDGHQEKVITALIRAAEGGSVRAYQAIVQTLGEGAPQRLEIGRMNEEQRQAFITAHKREIIDSMGDSEDDAPGLSDMLQLTYEERRQLIYESVNNEIATEG